MQRAMEQNFSWQIAGQKYEQLYAELTHTTIAAAAA
jgi:glycogen synthase